MRQRGRGAEGRRGTWSQRGYQRALSRMARRTLTSPRHTGPCGGPPPGLPGGRAAAGLPNPEPYSLHRTPGRSGGPHQPPSSATDPLRPQCELCVDGQLRLRAKSQV